MRQRTNGVEERGRGGRFQSGYIGIYITLLASRYLRACRAGRDITARSCILLLMASGMLVNFARVKRSTVRTVYGYRSAQSIDATSTAFSRIYSGGADSACRFQLASCLLVSRVYNKVTLEVLSRESRRARRTPCLLAPNLHRSFLAAS